MLKVQIADTPHALSQGLMFVDDLPQDQGMLFVFPRSHRLSFWGQNTYIPLDIAFIDDSNRIKKIARIEPHSLKAVTSDCVCQMAIEANEGYFKENGIDVGDKVEIDRGSQGSLEDKVARLFSLSKDWNKAFITFAKEGHSENREKDINSRSPNIKESQVLAPPDEMKIKKPDAQDKKVVGNPIPGPVQTPDGTEQTDTLPVVGPDDLHGFIEDFQKPNQQDISPEQVNNTETGVPMGSEQPEEIDENNTGELPEQPEEEQQEPEETENEYPQFSNPYEAMNWAQKNDETVRISYITKHGTQLVRDVEPHGMVHSESTYRELLVTFDETVGDIRAFILSNIKEWAFLKRKFSRKFVVRA